MTEKSIPEVLNCLFGDLYFQSRIFLLFLVPNEVSVDLFSIRPILYQDFAQPQLCPNLLVSMRQAKNNFDNLKNENQDTADRTNNGPLVRTYIGLRQ